MVQFLIAVFVGQLIIIKELALRKEYKDNRLRQGKVIKMREGKGSNLR